MLIKSLTKVFLNACPNKVQEKFFFWNSAQNEPHFCKLLPHWEACCSRCTTSWFHQYPVWSQRSRNPARNIFYVSFLCVKWSYPFHVNVHVALTHVDALNVYVFNLVRSNQFAIVGQEDVFLAIDVLETSILKQTKMAIICTREAVTYYWKPFAHVARVKPPIGIDRTLVQLVILVVTRKNICAFHTDLQAWNVGYDCLYSATLPYFTNFGFTRYDVQMGNVDQFDCVACCGNAEMTCKEQQSSLWLVQPLPIALVLVVVHGHGDVGRALGHLVRLIHRASQRIAHKVEYDVGNLIWTAQQ